jgi:RNA polymerase sigma factor (sigma-70 family)
MVDGESDSDPHPLDSTASLLARARSGDERARDRLFARFVPQLARWAHRRLPPGSRDLHETDDLVQITLVRALGRLDDYEHRGAGGFFAYLRQILLNAVRDEIRKAAGRKRVDGLGEGIADPGPSPLETAVGRDTMERYERGLARLSDDQREAVILKVELGLTNGDIAELLGRPSADAARMLVARALTHLAEAMRDRT